MPMVRITVTLPAGVTLTAAKGKALWEALSKAGATLAGGKRGGGSHLLRDGVYRLVAYAVLPAGADATAPAKRVRQGLTDVALPDGATVQVSALK